jgi:hypothetical protein
MKLELMGKHTIRKQRESLQKSLIEIAGNSGETRVNETIMAEILNSLYNHIEDLEQFICTGANIEYNRGDDGELDTDAIHFNTDLFEIK